MTVTDHQRARHPAAPLTVHHEGVDYPASEVGHGAAYELFADQPGPGWLPNPRVGAPWPYRRFVLAVECRVDDSAPAEDAPLSAPVSRRLSWAAVQELSQQPTTTSGDPMIAQIRRTATIRRGTRMVRVLTGVGLTEHLAGALPHGFCYRECDVAHLRTPADLAVLGGPGADGAAVFLLRWRAVDPLDYQLPAGAHFAGLVSMPAFARHGPPVIGTGFAPTARHLIPEFATTDFADLPLTAAASLVAYTEDGTEVPLYSYLPEQHAWIRMCGPTWRHLLTSVGIPADQEYFPTRQPMTRLVGRYHGELYDAIADPPDEFRLAAKTRAARYPVEELMRRTVYARWRGADCTAIRIEGDWLRIRLRRPDADQVGATGAECVARGTYEAWAPRSEVTDLHEVDIPYPM